MNQFTLNAEELHTVEMALRIASEQYVKDAAAAPELASQFNLQKFHCEELLARIEQEG